MNKAKLKSYAPQARKDFIAAVVARANLLGISEKDGKLDIVPSEKKGDVTLIAGQAWPAKVYEQRERLIKRMQKIGFGETAEAVAYTWFNRFAALRYMEIHDYLGHGHRVLSSREGGLPEILTHATELPGALPGLNTTQIADMKLAGNKDGELYRLLLVAQCNALSRAMPFLFERIDDETELLLPDNLLRTDSIVAKLVAGVPEEDWAEVEIIGWLYQFYISEKKDQVIGKVVKSEDIPAATQLFTPNWIVQYLVQNSVGRLWLMANPQSTLAKEWPYYITPAEQTPEVQAQLDALIRARCLEGVEGVVSDQWPVAREELTTHDSRLTTKVNSDQWPVASGETDGSDALSGIDRVAKGNELGGAGVSSHPDVSARGNLRTDQSGTAGSGIDTVQHSRGAGAQINGGIQPLSFDRTGIEGGGGDATLDSCSSTLFNSRASYTDAFAAGRNIENARHPADSPSLTTSHWSLTTPPLNPESITVLDPACGSGHILVVAYDVLKAIYLERGYQPRAIPRLILEKNLYGLDIDDRAAQMAGFALLMKARADDRRLFTATDEAGNLQPPKLNVLSLQESKGLSVDELVRSLTPVLPPLPLGEGWGEGSLRATITALVKTFEHAKTFGSLIQIPYALKTHLAVLPEVLALVKQSGDMYATAAADDLLPLVQQAQMLAMQFDAVVANPPFMGSKFYESTLKTYIDANYKQAKGDLYTCFMVRNALLAKAGGIVGMITIPNWMFLSTFEEFREWLFSEATLETFSHNGRGVFGSDFGSCAFTFLSSALLDYKGRFKRLFEVKGSVASNEELDERFPNARVFESSTNDFKSIPGSPIAYWASDAVRHVFSTTNRIGLIADTRKGMATGDNAKFVRLWPEVSWNSIGITISREDAARSRRTWFPYANGGAYRKWFGNLEDVVLWKDDGFALQNELHESGRIRAVNLNLDYIFGEGLTWTSIGSGEFSCRLLPTGALFSSAANSLFCARHLLTSVLAVLNSSVFSHLSKAINPTLNTNPGDAGRIPFPNGAALNETVKSNAVELIALSKKDWDNFELSWDFTEIPLVRNKKCCVSLPSAWAIAASEFDGKISRAIQLEEENNRLLIETYGLQDELSPEVPESQITLARADREKDSQRLISYAIGCMMGRYSLDEPGLIYAHAGNVGFEPGRYATFPADADGIVPITDELWFADDAPSSIREFLRAVWGGSPSPQPSPQRGEGVNANMAWLAESLGAKASETPDETIRRYIAGKFFKDHLQTYKKRPIYWLFSSGKQGAFQSLVYLHRYNESTLARMRAEYVVPLTGKMQSRIEMLEKDKDAASSTAARNKIAKQIEPLKKKHIELLAYDEKLRHYADMRITLDLDDGVKVNYGKFGDLLAEVKAVTGGAGDE